MESDKGFAALSLDSSSTSISAPTDTIDADGVPYLVALHSDPQLSGMCMHCVQTAVFVVWPCRYVCAEKVKYKLKSGTVRIGSSPECDIQLGGIYVLDHHCTLSCEEVLSLRPADGRVKKGAGMCTSCASLCALVCPRMPIVYALCADLQPLGLMRMSVVGMCI